MAKTTYFLFDLVKASLADIETSTVTFIKWKVCGFCGQNG